MNKAVVSKLTEARQRERKASAAIDEQAMIEARLHPGKSAEWCRTEAMRQHPALYVRWKRANSMRKSAEGADRC